MPASARHRHTHTSSSPFWRPLCFFSSLNSSSAGSNSNRNCSHERRSPCSSVLIFAFLRGRLITAAAISLAAVLIEFMATTSDDLSLGVFWHKACTCPVDPSDARILLSVAIFFVVIAGILGYMSGTGRNVQRLRPTLRSTCFMLTRPQSRLDLVLVPFLLAATAITVLPGNSPGLLLVGWLYLVHFAAFARPSCCHPRNDPHGLATRPPSQLPGSRVRHTYGPLLPRGNICWSLCLCVPQLQPLAYAKPVSLF